MSSTEDPDGGDPNKPSKPPDLGLDSSSGPSNEPTPQAHTVSQTQGDTSHPISPANTEHNKTEDDVHTTVEAHATMSQESDVSSIDPFELPVEQESIEETQGEADSNKAAVEPETPEAVQPPVSTAVQIPATTTTSNLSQTAPVMATTTTTQSVAITTTTSNTHTTIALIHQASTPEKEATPAIPVPGLTDPSPEELAADQGSGISPQQDLKTAIEDHFVSHSMSGLQLGDNSLPETDPKPDNVTSCGPGPSSDNQNPSAQTPLWPGDFLAAKLPVYGPVSVYSRSSDPG